MKKRGSFLMTAVVIGIFSLSGCQPSTPQGIVDAKIGWMNKVADIVDSVSDVESAKAAKEKFESIVEKCQALDDRLAEMEEPSAERLVQLKEHYQSKARPIFKRVKDRMSDLFSKQETIEMYSALRDSLKVTRDLGFR